VAIGKLKLLQSADRLLGPWLCRNLKPTAKKLKLTIDATDREQHSGPIPPEEVRRILVIRPGGLGDAALTYPLLRALRQGYPDARVDVLAEKRNAGIFEITDIVAKIHCYDSDMPAMLWRLRGAQYDIIIDTEQFHHFSTILANFLRPGYLCGFDTLGRRRFQTHSVPYGEGTYEAQSFLDLAEAVLGPSYHFDPDRYFIDVKPEARTWAVKTMEATGERELAVIAPTASGSSRLWPAARYAEVTRWLIGRNYFVVLLGGQDGIEAAGYISTHNDSGRVLNLAGRTTLAQSAAVLRQARLLVSADTGVMHLAYGIGTPTVSLFGSGLHRKWAPPGRHHRIVRKGLPCSPCIQFGQLPPCPFDIACMRDLGAGDVIAAIEDLLHG
jgi:ADP-heptose:LPS heptosyltransferase